MSTLEQRWTKKKERRWRAKIRLKGYPSLSKTFVNKTEARFWAWQTESKMRQYGSLDQQQRQNHSLSEAIDLYIRNVLPRYRASAKGRAQHLCWWQSQLGHIPLSEVSPALIAECRDNLSCAKTVRHTVRKPSTVNRYLSSLGHVFTIAVKEWGWLEQSPLKRVSNLKESPGRTRFLSNAERVKLLDACWGSPNPYLYLAVVLAISTAARKMEIMQLRWEDVDFENKQLTFHRTKNGHCRVVPLRGYALRLLKQRAGLTNAGLLFPGIVNPNKPLNLRVAWERALKESAVKDFRWHDLRHSSASYLAMSGATLIELSTILGHRTLQMVKRYAHLSENHTAGIVANMNQRIFGTGLSGQKRDTDF